jgi:hypothetical protein
VARVGLRDLAKRMKADSKTLDNERLQHRFQKVGATPIAQLTPRTPSLVCGEVKRMRIAPRRGVPALEVVISDGTGDAVAVFTGRRSIAGIENGRAITIEGITHDEHGRQIMMNPAYTLIS